MNRSGFVLGTVAALCVSLAGCAPRSFERALAYSVDKHGVRDASLRRAGKYWHLRFNELLISDLDEAIEAGRRGDGERMRRLALGVLDAAHNLAAGSVGNEIDRLPPAGKMKVADAMPRDAAVEALAAAREESGTIRDEPIWAAPAPRNPGPYTLLTSSRHPIGSETYTLGSNLEAARLDSAEALRAYYESSASAAQEALVGEICTLSDRDLRARLASIRRRIERAPDDKTRLLRQTLLACMAVPAWIGVAAEESKAEEKTLAKINKRIERGVVWKPRTGRGASLLERFAPVVVMEWPEERPYPEDYDRPGRAFLYGTPEDIQVDVDTDYPTVYAYESQAIIGGKRHTQLVYVTWFQERPSLAWHDPVVGHIDGTTLRITLDSRGLPAIFEVVLNCGCGHLVFVADRLEERVRLEFGTPEKGKRLAVEREVPWKLDVIVAEAVETPGEAFHPIVQVAAGYHEIFRIRADEADALKGVEVVETDAYELVPYGELDRLPLGDGIGSMFRADGLVYRAGKIEGYLIEPTGIFSAGQPRKRGTQKIRWDAYSFDDPHLLERTLRLPADF